MALYYVHSDPLNTPRQITRPSDNTPIRSWNVDPFGADAANPNPAGAGTFAYNLRLPGQVFDGQAGLHQNDFEIMTPPPEDTSKATRLALQRVSTPTIKSMRLLCSFSTQMDAAKKVVKKASAVTTRLRRAA